MSNCFQMIWDLTLEDPTKMAMWSENEGPVSYGKFCLRVAAAQKILRIKGFRQGDTVFFYATPDVCLYAAVAGVIGLGGKALFIDPWLTNAAEILRKLDAKFVYFDGLSRVYAMGMNLPMSNRSIIMRRDVAGESVANRPVICDVDESDPATMVFSSGSSGESKAIVRTHGYTKKLCAFLSQGDSDITRSGPDLSVMNGLALLHLSTGRGSILAGHRRDRRHLRKINAISRGLNASTLSCGPAFLEAFLGAAKDSTLKKIYVGGASADNSLMRRAFDVFPNTEFVHVYGSTEVEPIAICDARLAVEKSEESGFQQMLYIGQPVGGVETKNVNDELWVRAPHMTVSTIEFPASSETAKYIIKTNDAWLHTGDRVILRDNEMFYAGRSSLPAGRFLAEQELYSKIGHTSAFIAENTQGTPYLCSQYNDDGKVALHVLTLEIARDRRHKSRIDRRSTLCLDRSLSERFAVYLAERSPLPVLAFIAIGPSLAAQLVGDILSFTNLALTSAFVVLAMIFMRLADEAKDLAKDLRVHPTRPIPRGLISTEESRKIMNAIMAAMIVLVIAASGTNVTALGCGMSAIALCHLISRDFYARAILAKRLVLNTMIHQIVVFPLYGYAFALSGLLMTRESCWFLSGAWSCSLLYEFSRKMGLKATTDLASNYSLVLGHRAALAVVLACLAIYGLSAFQLGLAVVGWAIAALCLYIIGSNLSRDQDVSYLEAAAVTANLTILWALPLKALINHYAAG
jgi:acyl-CoA synthetase (AMP-forming)/AMP-acid ligase II